MSVKPLPFEIRRCSEWGRYLTATTEYAVGDLIFDEAPFLIAPIRIDAFIDKEENDELSISCVGCCRVISTVPGRCKRCSWPICNSWCEQESFHQKFECALFRKNKVEPIYPFGLKRLTILRACLMYKDDEDSSNWKSFTTMSSKLAIESDDFKARVEKDVSEMTEWINQVCKLEVDKTTVSMIFRTFIMNGFTIYDKDKDDFLYLAECLYKTAGLFAHSCCPNSDWFILPTDQNGIKRWHFRLYARTHISPNDPITVAYKQDCLSSDTATRKIMLKKHLHFDCKCERCNDVSEFGLYTMAMKCCYCGNTRLLPDDLNDEVSDWTCAHCGNCIESCKIKSWIEKYDDDLTSIEGRQGLNGEIESRLESLLNTSDERNLTANHRVITWTIYSWLKSQTLKDLLEHTEESQRKFVKILERAKKCLIMFRMFGTLQNVVRVELIFAKTIATYFFKTGTACSIEYDKYSHQEKNEIISSVLQHLNTVVQIVKWNENKKLYDPFRDTAFLQLKFWEKQLKALQRDDVGPLTRAKGLLGSGKFITSLGNLFPFRHPKVAPAKQLKGVQQDSAAQFAQSSSVSSSAASAVVSRSIEVKPDVSLLSQYNFNYK